jgi:hypothetical protein
MTVRYFYNFSLCICFKFLALLFTILLIYPLAFAQAIMPDSGTPSAIPALEFLNMSPDAASQQEKMYEKLARHYLSPWLPITDESSEKIDNMKAPVTQRMLHLMEYVFKGGSFRVRYIKETNKLIYRVIMRYNQGYRFDRMVWILRTLSAMGNEGQLQASFDAVFYVGDGPKATQDTYDKFSGFPLFSLRTSPIHVDIPIPDPVVYGSNGNYVWPKEARLVPWTDKKPMAVFRGKASCLKMQADNWHVCNRVRAAKLANYVTDQGRPLLDIGITEWNQIPMSKASLRSIKARNLIHPPSRQEIELSTNLTLSLPMDYMAQCRFKYIIDLDGGLGSSRKAGILGSSGSLLLAQDSPWKCWYEPCLLPYYHYVPFSKTLNNLIECVEWAKAHDTEAETIVHNAQDFADRFLSIESAKKYFATLLNIYAAELLVDTEMIKDEDLPHDLCALTRDPEITRGPLGCSRGWFTWDNATSPAFWKSYARGS